MLIIAIQIILYPCSVCHRHPAWETYLLSQQCGDMKLYCIAIFNKLQLHMYVRIYACYQVKYDADIEILCIRSWKCDQIWNASLTYAPIKFYDFNVDSSLSLCVSCKHKNLIQERLYRQCSKYWALNNAKVSLMQ